MNLSELFFFKVFPCQSLKQFGHDDSKCYYNHPNSESTSDIRRPPLNFNNLILTTKKISQKTLNSPIYNNSDNQLEYYEDYLNNELPFIKGNYCKNKIEYLYHIHRYSKSKCLYTSSGFECPLGVFCYNEHEDNIHNMQEIAKMSNFIKKTQTQKNSFELKIFLFEYSKILEMPNRFINPIIYEEMKKNKENFLSNTTSEINTECAPASIYEVLEEQEKLNQKIYNEFSNKIIYKQLNIRSIEDIKYIINEKEYLSFNCRFLPNKKDLVKIIYAFFNSHDGYIIAGISNADVVGAVFNRRDKEQFRTWFKEEFTDVLVKYDNKISLNFYSIDTERSKCLFVIQIKKIDDKKLLVTKLGKYYILNDKCIDNFNNKTSQLVTLEDIKELNLREYLKISSSKLLRFYNNKKEINKQK